jgi:hypothetical protein
MKKEEAERVFRATSRVWKKASNLMREKKIKEAFDLLEKHVEKYPLDVGILLYLAQSYEFVDDRVTASVYYVKASQAFANLGLEQVAQIVIYGAFERVRTRSLMLELRKFIPCEEIFRREITSFNKEFPQAKKPGKKSPKK